MADTSVTPSSVPHTDIHLSKWQWLAMTTSMVGVPMGSSRIHVEHANYADRTIQITGTLGAGGTVIIEGSNDGGVTWATLNDAFGNALSLTALAIKQITECAEQIRPRVSAGDATTSLNIYCFMRKIFE